MILMSTLVTCTCLLASSASSISSCYTAQLLLDAHKPVITFLQLLLDAHKPVITFMVHTHVPRLHGSCSSKQHFAYYGSLATILIAGYDHFSHTCQHHLFIAINKGGFFLHRIAIESENKIIWTCVATQCRNGNFSFLVMQYAFK